MLFLWFLFFRHTEAHRPASVMVAALLALDAPRLQARVYPSLSSAREKPREHRA
jgi:hypothetical protein